MSVGGAEELSYSQQDFLYDLGGGDSGVTPSKFDIVLDSRWRAAMDKGLFRFKLDEDIATVRLPGKFGLYVQANSNRHKTRRSPAIYSSTRQPFNAHCFNFCRAPDHERLFRVTSLAGHAPISDKLDSDWLAEKSRDHLQQPIGNGAAASTNDDWILINVSPIGVSHSLLVPSLSRMQPQQLKTDGLALLVDLLLLSNGRSLRGIYNSLGALSSVNHFHLHLYRFHRPLYLETAEAERLSDRVLCVRDYPAPALLFIIDRYSHTTAVRDICRFTDQLLDMGLAFNMFITRGTDPRSVSHRQRPEVNSTDMEKRPEQSITLAEQCDGHDAVGLGHSTSPSFSTPTTKYSVLRVYVWARQPEFDQSDVTVASCELAGHFTLHDDTLLHSETEEELAEQMSQITKSSFERVCNELFSS